MTQVDQNSFAYNAISSIVSYFGIVPNPENIEQTIVETKKKIEEQTEEKAKFINEISELNTIIDELKKDVKRITDANATIAELYKKALEEDSIAVDEGRKAAGILKEIRTYIKATAEKLGVSSKKKDDPKEMVEKILDEVNKVMDRKDRLEKAISRFDSPSQPTVSQSVAAVAVKKNRWIYGFFQYAGVLK